MDGDKNKVLSKECRIVGFNEVEHGFKDASEDHKCCDIDRKVSSRVSTTELHVLLNIAVTGESNCNYIVEVVLISAINIKS